MSGTLWKGMLFVDIACGELSWEMAFVVKIIMKTLLIRGDVSISIWAVINATGYGASIKPDKDLPSHLTSVICTLSFLQRKPVSLGKESQTSWIRYEHFVNIVPELIFLCCYWLHWSHTIAVSLLSVTRNSNLSHDIASSIHFASIPILLLSYLRDLHEVFQFLCPFALIIARCEKGTLRRWNSKRKVSSRMRILVKLCLFDLSHQQSLIRQNFPSQCSFKWRRRFNEG